MNNPLKKIVEQVECVCNRSDGLFIPSRHVSMLTASLLMMFFVTFLSGYFFGKKFMVEQFVAKIEQDSFADQIYSSLCALSEYEPEELRALAAQDQEAAIQDMCEDTDQDMQENNTVSVAQNETLPVQEPVQQNAQATDQPGNAPQLVAQQEVVSAPAKSYYAPLAGYGTEAAAKSFVDKLKRKNVSATIKKHTSKTAKGAQRTWFQVVTRSYSDRDTLEKVVDRITKEEKLKGVSIVTC